MGIGISIGILRFVGDQSQKELREVTREYWVKGT